MKLRRTSAALAVAATVGLTATAVPGPAEARALGNRSLATVLSADGNHFDRNWGDFDIVHRAVTTVLDAKPKSPVGVLADGSTKLTAFIPTDAAFRRLVTDVTGSRPATEKRTFAKIAKAFDVKTIEAVLLYHVVPGARITYKQARQADGAKLMTALKGAKLKVLVRKGVVLRDGDANDANARVLPALKDLNKGNKQIAHGINRVLRPVNLP